MRLPVRSAIIPAAVAAACLATACSSVLGLGDFKNGPADAGSNDASAGAGGSTQTDGGGGAAGMAGSGGAAGTAGSGGAAGSGCTSNTDCQGSSAGPICNKSSGNCVQCLTAGDCSGSGACCSSKCADLSSDPHNCGTCGHDCLGGACSAGQCQPVLLGQTNDNVSVMALDGGYLYWGIFDSGPTAAVKRMPVGGGTTETVAPANYADALAFDSSNIYFVTSNSATSSKVPVLGQTSKASLGSSQTYYNSTAGIPMAGLALAGNRLYWVRATAAGGSAIESIGTDGTGATAVVSNYNPDPFDPRPLVTDGSYLYWFDYPGPTGSLDSYPILNGSGTAQILVTTNVDGDLALSGSYVYFLEKYNSLSYVANALKSGSGQSGTLLSPGETKIWDFVIDGTTLIWSAGANGTVKSLTIGSNTPTTLAAAANAHLLAVDAKSVYWWTGNYKFYRLAR